MPELKNNFLRSKMNKDLDERLVPNGEYRDALGVNIRQSEGPNVGALEVVQGNEKLWALNSGMRFVGRFNDEINNTIYLFATDYDGEVRATGNTEHKILKSVAGGAPITLVEGYFLNFSQKNFMTGINILENLLFFTDNRNQPRVIDVEQSLGYYTKEEHLSVSKFAPYKPISVLQQRDQDVVSFTGPSDIELDDVGNATDPDRIKKGDVIYNVTQDAEYGHVESVDYATNTITSDRDLTTAVPPGYVDIKTPNPGSIIRVFRSTMTDESSDPLWPGDPDFLEDKFVRFSYRFQYENNEYSLVAPWTQPLFIPQQDGFFIDNIYNSTPFAVETPEDQDNAFKSTILSFFQNKINNAVLYVPFPSNTPIVDYKIKAVEILYKESDGLVQKIVEVVQASDITFSSYKPQENYYAYTYQSKKPYRALPENVTTRVADKVPVKALSQEIISNRVVYGNFADRYDPPSVSYTTQSGPRTPEFGNDIGEYPNHTLKQNRNYSVGVVLYDKFGRASTVILSNIVPAPGEKISTLYHAYKDELDLGYTGNGIYRVYDWMGDGLRINFQQPITEAPSSNYPGTYAQATIFTLDTGNTTTITTTAPFTYTIVGVDFTAEMPVDNYLRGYYVDYTKIISSTFTAGNTVIVTEEQIADIYEYTGGYSGLGTLEPKQSYVINPEGWYSYRIVVQQTEQDYYNVFLPGLTNGYPFNSTYLSVVTGGSTYTLATDVATTTGGSGVGLTVDITEVDINGSIRTAVINTPGVGYQLFDTVQIAGGSGSGNLRILELSTYRSTETNRLSTTPLISDNINKVPRDLSEVGPDQTQYRSSSVELYLRVNNTNKDITTTLVSIGADYSVSSSVGGLPVSGGTGTGMLVNIITINGTGGITDYEIRDFGVGYSTGDVVDIVYAPATAIAQLQINAEAGKNVQFFPGRTDHYVSQIGSEQDLLNFVGNSLVTSIPFQGYYGGEGNPLIAVIDTPNDITGVTYTQWKNDNDILPRLAVYETEPVESLLDIYWESSTTGLVSDLNEAINVGFSGVFSLSPITTTLVETIDYSTTPTVISNDFKCLDSTGGFASGVVASIFKVVDTNGTGTDVTALNYFSLNTVAVGPPQSEFNIQCNQNFTYLNNSDTVDRYVITIETILGGETTYHDTTVVLQNTAPIVVGVTPIRPIVGGVIEIFPSETFVADVNTITNGATPISTRLDGVLFDIINEQRILPTAIPTNIFTISTPVLGAFYGESELTVDPTQTVSGELYQLQLRVRDASAGVGSLTSILTVQVLIKSSPELISSSGCVDDRYSGWAAVPGTCLTPVGGTVNRVLITKSGFNQFNGNCYSGGLSGDFTCDYSWNSAAGISAVDSSWRVNNISADDTNLEAVYVSSVVVAGTGYAPSTVYNTNVTSGPGLGMTIEVTSVGGSGEVLTAKIVDFGDNYSNGDTVILVGGSGTAEIEVDGALVPQSGAFVAAMHVITPNAGLSGTNQGNEWQFFPPASRPAGRQNEIYHRFRLGSTCNSASTIPISNDYNTGTGAGDLDKARIVFNAPVGNSQEINHVIDNIYRGSVENASRYDTIAFPSGIPFPGCTNASGDPLIGTFYMNIKIKALDAAGGRVFGPTWSPGSQTGWTYYDNNKVIAERTIGWVVSDMYPYWSTVGAPYTCEVGFNDPAVSRLFQCTPGYSNYPCP